MVSRRVVYGEGGLDVGYRRPLKKRIEGFFQRMDAEFEFYAPKQDKQKAKPKPRQPVKRKARKIKYRKQRSILEII